MIYTSLTLEAMQDKAAEAADFMRLFSTPSRLMLLCHIAQKERSVGEIQENLGLKQPALSQQLAELRQSGVVETRRESRQIYYSIADDRVAVVMDMLLRMFCSSTVSAGVADQISRESGATIPIKSPLANVPDEMARWALLDSID